MRYEFLVEWRTNSDGHIEHIRRAVRFEVDMHVKDLRSQIKGLRSQLALRGLHEPFAARTANDLLREIESLKKQLRQECISLADKLVRIITNDIESI